VRGALSGTSPTVPSPLSVRSALCTGALPGHPKAVGVNLVQARIADASVAQSTAVGIVVDHHPAGAAVVVAGRAGETEDVAVVAHLVECGAALFAVDVPAHDRDRRRIVVEHLPAETGLAVAGRAEVSKDAAAVLELIESDAGRDSNRRGVVVQHLPTRTGLAVAGRSDELEDAAVVVQLIEASVAAGRDAHGRWIIVQHLPARTGHAVAGRTRELEDAAVLVQLIERALAGCERQGPGIVVERLPTVTGLA